MLAISVLGPLEVRRDGLPVPVPSGRATQLLVRLALDAGTVVSTDRLLEELWADDAPTANRNTLQSKVAMLRRAFDGASPIESGDGGYRIAIEPDGVDALRVVGQAAEATRLLRAGEERPAAELSEAALAQFRGDVVPSAGDGRWVAPHRARLDETRISLLETMYTARLRLGEISIVVVGLEPEVDRHPFAESLWELLITALYRAGRQADALAAYQRLRRLLSDQLGLEPTAELRRLEQRILVHDPTLGGPEPATPEPPRRTGNLPALAAELVGRDGDLESVCRLVDRHRLVEIVGPGGVGKTALSIAVGRAVEGTAIAADGVWLVRLESAVTADDVVDTVIAAMAITGGEDALVERLRATKGVLILDNCEHVLDAAADLTVRLLDAAPGLRIVATTQVALDVDGEAIHDLAPLELDAAAELFRRRAASHRSARVDGDHADAVHELCRSLDGLPLAIELAAARARTLSVEDITRRLEDRFEVLTAPGSRRPERRRALRATIRWSYDLLFPDDQRGLWALATFAGGATLDAAESVLDALDVPAQAAMDVVGRLAARSLVIVDDAGTGSVRYRLLDSIRAYALDAMAEHDALGRGRSAHVAWFAAHAASSTTGARSDRQAEHLAFARVERANIDAALAWCTTNDPVLGLEIAVGYGWAWVVLGDSRAAQRITTALGAAGELAPAHMRANGRLLAGWLEASLGHLESARAHLAEAEAIGASLDDPELEARVASYLAYVVSHEGRFEEAIELTDHCRVLLDPLDRPWDQVANGLFAARAAISAGDEPRAIAASDHVRRWLRSVDDPWLHVRADAMFGELARIQHRFDDAVAHTARAAATSHRLGFLQTEAYQLSCLGRAQCQAGDYPAGMATLELSIEKAEATGDVRMVALARVHLGRVARALGRTERARAALEAAGAWHRHAGGGEQAALGDCLLAALDAADGHPGAATRLTAALDGARASGQAHVEVFALDALARSAAIAGDDDLARECLARADGRMATTTHFISEWDRVDARAVEPARPHLDG